MTDQAKKDPLVVQVNIPGDLPPPLAANFFSVSRMDSTVQIISAYVDVNQAAALNEKRPPEGPPPSLTALPLSRLVVDIRGFLHLKAEIERIHKHLVDDNRIPKELVE